MEKILNGRELADKLNYELNIKILKAVRKTGIKPTLATILVGRDPASKVYVNIKHRTCATVGIESVMVELEDSISKDELIRKIKELNNDESIHGILLQLPLPPSLYPFTTEVIEHISYLKDVDGFHPINRGKLFDYNETLVACTPKGIIALLEHNKIDLKGKNITIINRSNLVGKPLIFMLLKRNATVSICHTSTINIEEQYLKHADIIIVGVGQPNFITKEKIKKGAIIIDVGTNRVDGKLCGDVNYNDVIEKCGKITPTPGGVGPMTVCFLLQNTFTSYKKQLNIDQS